VPAVGAWALGFAPVAYLALSGGGYDAIIRGQVGILAWWIVLLGVLCGVASVARLDRSAWLAIAALAAFAGWVGLASGWSESAERSVIELGRVAALLGVFVLGLLTVRRGGSTPLVNGMACAFGLVALLAVLSRLHPDWFPGDQVAQFLGASARLNYPLNYANGTGNFLAIGVPLLLGVATRARTIAGQALAGAALPVVVLAVALTISRGAVLTAIVGLAVFFVLSDDRIPKLVTAAVAGGGGAWLVLALVDRDALRDGLQTPVAFEQAGELELIMALVCAVVAVIEVGVALAARSRERSGWLRISPRPARWMLALGVVIALTAAVAAGVPGQLSTQWNTFKSADGVAGAVDANAFSRLGTVAGSHRYQYWQSAMEAQETRPWTGRGPGTFEFWWAREGSVAEFIRDAHSLYLQTLAETGIVGLLLLGAFLLTLLGAGTVRTFRAPAPLRHGLATATAGLAAFCAAAAYDWVWQIAVVPVAALLLGACLVAAPGCDASAEAQPAARSPTIARIGIAALAVAGLLAVVVPYATTSLIRDSRAKAGEADFAAALEKSQSAQRLQPWAASPRLQRALVLEQAGDVEGAATAAAQATAREATNWRTWLVRSRIEARRGRVRTAVQAYRRARSLNPRSPIFAR